jgi:hypothetical protein
VFCLSCSICRHLYLCLHRPEPYAVSVLQFQCIRKGVLCSAHHRFMQGPWQAACSVGNPVAQLDCSCPLDFCFDSVVRYATCITLQELCSSMCCSFGGKCCNLTHPAAALPLLSPQTLHTRSACADLHRICLGKVSQAHRRQALLIFPVTCAAFGMPFKIIPCRQARGKAGNAAAGQTVPPAIHAC